MELALLLADDELEVVGEEEITEVIEQQTPDGMVIQMPYTRYNIEVKRRTMGGQVVMEPVPPEEFKIASDCTTLDLQEVGFCAHETEKTVSWCLGQGWDKNTVLEAAAGDDDDLSDEPEYRSRFDDVEDNSLTSNAAEIDQANRKVMVSECYKMVDLDGDGIAERYKITLLNRTTEIDREAIDYVPFVAITPIVMPHRFFGRSVAETVMDVQFQKSVLLRNILDNLYLQNNQRMGYVEGEVNVQQMLDSRPGGVVGMSSPNMLFPIQTPSFSGHAFGMLEYMDGIRENRTGVTRYNQGIDANSLNKTAEGINRIMDASGARVELIARLFGEGVKRLMLMIHKLLLQYQDKEMMVQMRGEWVPVQPTEWRERYNMTVSVGLGTGSAEQQLEALMAVKQMQQEALQMGMATPQHIYNTYAKIVEAAKLKHPELYFKQMTPEELQGWMQSQGQPDPQTELAMRQVGAMEQSNQVSMQKNQMDYDIKQRELMLKEQEIRVKAEENELKRAEYGLKIKELDVKDTDSLRDYDARLKVADLKSNTDLAKEVIKNSNTPQGENYE
jgi:hypothetical protein